MMGAETALRGGEVKMQTRYVFVLAVLLPVSSADAAVAQLRQNASALSRTATCTASRGRFADTSAESASAWPRSAAS